MVYAFGLQGQQAMPVANSGEALMNSHGDLYSRKGIQDKDDHYLHG